MITLYGLEILCFRDCCRLTFSRYTRFGTKLALFFCLAKTSKYKTNFKLNQMPKSRVTCVMQRCDTSEKHQSSSVPIFQPNVSNFSTFQFWSLSIVGSFSVFCLSSELCFSIKIQKKKKRKNFPLSVFRKVIHICLSFVFRFQILSLLCVG